MAPGEKADTQYNQYTRCFTKINCTECFIAQLYHLSCGLSKGGFVFFNRAGLAPLFTCHKHVNIDQPEEDERAKEELINFDHFVGGSKIILEEHYEEPAYLCHSNDFEPGSEKDAPYSTYARSQKFSSAIIQRKTKAIRDLSTLKSRF